MLTICKFINRRSRKYPIANVIDDEIELQGIEDHKIGDDEF